MKKINLLLFASFLLALTSCSSSDDATAETNANLIVKLKFDENQVRLDNLVNPSVIAQGNAAQTPVMNEMSAHYLELSPTANTLIGQGEVIYKGEETTKEVNKLLILAKKIL